MSKVPIRFSSEGSTGEYRPEPSEIEVPRLGGAGIDGIEPAEDLGRKEHLRAVRAGEVGSIHSWELVTAVDGPGTRMTTFFSGCPLRCVYCHNPDTLHMRDGNAVTAQALMKKIKRYRAVFRATGGGVTFSGGEPLFQPAFLARLLRECKEYGIHTAIDTSGFLGSALTDEMMENLDLVLLDVKSGLPYTYQRTTERDLAPTIRFGQRLSDAGKPMWIRFVVVPGWTDAPENVEAVADIVEKWSSVERVEVLPFHQMARDKWDNLGLEYKLENVEPPAKEAVERVREVFRKRGILTF